MAFLNKVQRSPKLAKPARREPVRVPEPPPPVVRVRPRPKPSGIGCFVLSVRRDLGLLLDGIPWTQGQLAVVVGSGHATISAWEKGRMFPRQGELDTLARLLEMARNGVDPRTIAAPDVKQLLEDRGPTAAERKSATVPRHKPVKPPRKKQRSIIDPRRRVIPGKRFSTPAPLDSLS